MKDDSRDNRKRLKLALLLTAGFMVAEVVGGIVSGSLALLADAGHMLADSLALALALLAFRLSLRPADAKRSYGYHRFQTLAAFVNGLALIVVVVWILVEAAGRLMAPPPVMGGIMLAVAGAGLLVNVLVFLILHGGDRHNLNMQGALLHVLSDLLGSIAALSAAIVIVLTGWMPIDPILSIVVAGLILRSAWQLVRRSAHILLEGTPETFDVDGMQQSLISAVPQIASIHHVHVWGLTPQRLMLTMHVSLRGEFRDATVVIRQVKRLLQTEYGVRHSTIEVEFADCSDRQ